MTYSLRVLPIAAFLLLAPSFAQAQQPDNSAPARLNNSATPQPNGPSGTDPGNIGNTGWTGGRPDTHKESSDQGAIQPAVASGADLKGPTEQFPASKTPE